MLLLFSSCYFYMAFIPIYILILGFTIIVDYFAGILIEKSSGKKRKLFLIASLISNCGVLAIFKYYNFLNDNLNVLLQGFNLHSPMPFLSILLPIGLSFHTFQAMSYTIEVYRGRQDAERNFGIYALYVMFYPQLVAGPIERPQNLIPQFRQNHDFDYEGVTSGIKLMAWGLFKKVVVADRLAQVVDFVYDKPGEFHGIALILASLFFSFQIYCDFSGYSDMAIGAARIMGIKLMRNFDRPYTASNFTTFWKKWHISLSTWFRDYLYIPLGGNRVELPRWVLNIILVFTISGLWHGANWTFVIWGALHGFYLIASTISKKIRNNLASALGLLQFESFNKGLKTILTFALTTFAWIFFRANSLHDAFYIVKNSFVGLSDVFNIFKITNLKLELGISLSQLAVAVLVIIVMIAFQTIHAKRNINHWLAARSVIVRWGFYYSALFILFFFGVYENRQFIYFQF
jgi:alginate O-acetyltransferase complex protein AlgI